MEIEVAKSPGLRGATVARLTPDQKVACSNHVGVTGFFRLYQKENKLKMVEAQV